MGRLSTAEKNKRKRERKKQERAREKKELPDVAVEDTTATTTADDDPTAVIEIDYVPEEIPTISENDDAVSAQAIAVLRRFKEREAQTLMDEAENTTTITTNTTANAAAISTKGSPKSNVVSPI